MKKYKQSIHIGANITDIMRLSCINKCEKEVVERNVYADLVEGPFATSHHLIFTYTLDDGRKAREGDWLLQDVCDHWHVMNEREYQKHKDDKI